MNKQEQRFHAAKSLLERVYPIARGDITFDEIASECVEMADALLAELDRTASKPEPATYGGWRPCPTCGNPMATVKESLTAQPDADGWIPHRPGDAPPLFSGHVHVRFRDGEEPEAAAVWDWDDNDSPCDIVAWKPAK
jgi:hypothetical protein